MDFLLKMQKKITKTKQSFSQEITQLFRDLWPVTVKKIINLGYNNDTHTHTHTQIKKKKAIKENTIELN